MDLECGLFDLEIAEYLLDAQASSYSIDSLALKHLNLDPDLPEAFKGTGKQRFSDLSPDDLVCAAGKAVSLFSLFMKSRARNSTIAPAFPVS